MISQSLDLWKGGRGCHQTWGQRRGHLAGPRDEVSLKQANFGVEFCFIFAIGIKLRTLYFSGRHCATEYPAPQLGISFHFSVLPTMVISHWQDDSDFLGLSQLQHQKFCILGNRFGDWCGRLAGESPKIHVVAQTAGTVCSQVLVTV